MSDKNFAESGSSWWGEKCKHFHFKKFHIRFVSHEILSPPPPENALRADTCGVDAGFEVGGTKLGQQAHGLFSV